MARKPLEIRLNSPPVVAARPGNRAHEQSTNPSFREGAPLLPDTSPTDGLHKYQLCTKLICIRNVRTGRLCFALVRLRTPPSPSALRPAMN
ncbi:hypothetical protein GWI33_017547 [Rhynchophorus ferrugineus]|uniref:Uncharacterized protein n=1 Tax=Rhynchophorus ferrugineus TaxID=354439 RepID=A0A834M3P2_RHYFE|nr:hypothetical protein GWI33_017547 [Rhynchophorus ferrugineus]